LSVRRPPLGIALLGAAIAAAAALPAIYLGVVLFDDFSAARETLTESRTVALGLRSLGLAAAVTLSAAAIAVPLAWLTTRTDLPGARVWAVLATLPLVIPSYIGAYLFVSALGPRGLAADALGIEELPSIYGFPGAWLVLTLFTYPMVLLTVRAALRGLDPDLEEVARGMGRSPLAVFRTVVLPQLVPAIGVGCLLVALYVLSDFGAVSIMRFDSFTREIYIAYQSSFDRTAAAALGMVLVLVMVALFVVYGRARRSMRYHRASPGTARPPARSELGRWRYPALAACALFVGLALVLPVGVLVYWVTQGVGADPNWPEVWGNSGNSLAAGVLAAAVGAACALVIATLIARYPSRLSNALERAGTAGYALPGIVVALALVFFSTRVLPSAYQTFGLLVFALAVHYMPLAFGPIAARLLQVPPRVEEAARGLGRSPIAVFATITTPLVAGGVFAGAALVFLHAVKELPATLILAPIGFETLATDIWRQTSAGFFEAGAIPALALLVLSAPIVLMLSERGAPAP
jgi:iron(III) transport system permease protein